MSFSAGTETQLSDALANYLTSWQDERHDLVRTAIERLCREARERSIGPEVMLVAVKAAWTALPESHKLDPERKRIAFDRVFGYCLDAYYG